jgi:hypothetical protein
MKKAKLTLHAAIGAALLLCGCVLSTSSLFEEKEAIFDERLVGSWREVAGNDRAVVQRDGIGYSITYSDSEDTARFQGRLGKVGNALFLDVWPAPADTEMKSGYRDLMLPAHMLLKVDLRENEVGLAVLDKDVFATRLKSLALPYRLEQYRLILFASTPQMRSAITKVADRPGSFEKTTEWRREAVE